MTAEPTNQNPQLSDMDEPLTNLETAVRAAMALAVMDEKGANIGPAVLPSLRMCVADSLEHWFGVTNEVFCGLASQAMEAAKDN